MGQLFIPEYVTGTNDFNAADLVILRGQPGAGKSTWAGKFMQRMPEGSIISLKEADQFFTTASGEYDFRKELLPQAHAWCLGEVRKELRSGHRVIVANTFTRLYMLQPYLEAARDMNKSVAIIRIFSCFHSTKPGINRQTVIRHIREYEDFSWDKYESQVLNPPVASREKIEQLVNRDLDSELAEQFRKIQSKEQKAF